jgi:hypothetical protein
MSLGRMSLEEEDVENRANAKMVLRCENMGIHPLWLGQDASDLSPHPDAIMNQQQGGDITET